MKKTFSIPLSRVRGLGALPALLEEKAGERALLKAFDEAGIPLSVKADPSLPVPTSGIARLFTLGAQQTGSRTFGLDVGKHMTYRAFGNWSEYSTMAPSLEAGLRRLVSTVWAQVTETSLSLTQEGNHCVWRVTTPVDGTETLQYADHALFPMISFAQTYLGEEWQPDWIEVNYPRDAAAREIEARLNVPVRFDCPSFGIAIKMHDLVKLQPQRSPISQRTDLRTVHDDLVMHGAPEPALSFSAIVYMRLLDGHSDIQGACALAGLSVQGLQRRLRQKGLTYKDVLEAARKTRAISLLLETSLPVSEIAFSLGYEEHANFTRAFHRWTGCSPSKFRERNRVKPFAFEIV